MAHPLQSADLACGKHCAKLEIQGYGGNGEPASATAAEVGARGRGADEERRDVAAV